MRRFFLALTLVASPAALMGCDAVAGLAGVDEFDVNLGDEAAFAVVPDTTLTSSTSVDLDQSLPDVFDVEHIMVPEAAVTYEPAVSSSGRSGGNVCTMDLWVMVDQVPAVQATIEIDESAENPVQSVSSRFAEGYDREAICDRAGDACPVITDARTPDEIRAGINAAVESGAFGIDLVASNDGPCAGLLRAELLHFALDF